jgi:hypothetical protein
VILLAVAALLPALVTAAITWVVFRTTREVS